MGDEILGIKGLSGENLYAGVGYIIIPDGIDVEKYKEDVYRTGKISIYGGYGHSNFYNIHIDREVLQRITFPKKVGENGSPVVWLNIPKHNEPIIISAIKEEETLHTLSEFRKRITKSFDGTMVDIDLDAKKGSIVISAMGNEDKRGEININVGSINNDGVLKIDINGDLLIKSSNRIIQVSEDTITNAITDKSGITKAFFKLNSNKDEDRFQYRDEFDNEITAKKDEVVIKAKKIIHSDGEEPMLLGQVTVDYLKDLIDLIEQMTFSNSAGVTGVTINKGSFDKLKGKIDKLKSKISWLD